MSSLTAIMAEFSEEKLQSVSDHVYAQAWQNTGGVMQFPDALGVFKTVLEELRAADDEGLITSMPVALQQTIQTHLTNVQSNFHNILANNNQVQSFTDEVDRMHLTVWQGGFRYRGKKLLGYEAKYQQAVTMAKEIERVREREAAANQLVEQVTDLLTQAQSASTQLTAAKATADQQIAVVADIHTRAVQADSDLATPITAINTKLEEATESASEAQAKSQSATTSEKRLQDFMNRVDASETKLSEALQEAATGLTKNSTDLAAFMNTATTDVDAFKTAKTTELDEFQTRLGEIEKDIVKKLSNATGITLFHAFEEKRKWSVGHVFWLAFAVAVAWYALSQTTSVLNALKGQPLDGLAYIKIGLSLPAILLAGFALSQYGKERRLREEYAFKSKISLSLEPYRKLVDEAIGVLAPDDRVRFADFLIQSIGIIFESPTERVFGTKRTSGPNDLKIVSGFLQRVKEGKDIVQGK